jgi:2-polyprenyl-3-methyl-5-hydroxy-6-metoxy-1,4-benzoquinol methylase
MKQLNDELIIRSWQKNTSPWIAAIRDAEIVSRIEVTNKAVIDTIKSSRPTSLLDVGCGEGWLIRELADSNINALGIDAIAEFIKFSAQAGKGRFRQLAYEDVSYQALNEKFDVIVCNFSLLGYESVEHLFSQVPALLNDGGFFIVQTLHPKVVADTGPYEDGWREGSWDGFSAQFVDPAPWYFRTLESWQSLFSKSGFDRLEFIEPLNPETNLPASIIFVARQS